MPRLLSPSFTLEELTFSQTAARQGIANRPDASQIRALTDLCGNVLQPLRDAVALPISITSGYRSSKLNRAIGGSHTSQHMDGEAADIVCFGLQTKKLFKSVIELNLPFDQLIYEGGRQSIWVHVSFVPRNGRGQILAATFPEAGGVVYTALTRSKALNL